MINGLTDYAHPCQALADLYTLKELVGSLAGHTLAFIGDANNVARSLLEGCGQLGVRFVMATPKGYRFDGRLSRTDRRSQIPDARLPCDRRSGRSGPRGAGRLHRRLGQHGAGRREREAPPRFRRLSGERQADGRTPRTRYFMHCLPAHRGEEVTDEVIDGPQSVVVAEAANRMHVQKGILAWLLGRQAR